MRKIKRDQKSDKQFLRHVLEKFCRILSNEFIMKNFRPQKMNHAGTDNFTLTMLDVSKVNLHIEKLDINT